MLMRDIMKKTWSERYQTYTALFEMAMSLPVDELYEQVKRKSMTFYSYPATNMNLLPCSICAYRSDNQFGGCSMCNYDDDDIQHKAYISALRKKNVLLYAKAIRKSFENVRGRQAAPNIFELVSSDDIFNENQFPEEVFHELFKSDNLFSKRPFTYIFETRASSVTPEKLALLKKNIPKSSRVTIEFGVETGNEWIRNHWLNKGVSDIQISNAIELIHGAGYKASADILIGIPGMTEMQSKDIFVETVFALEKLGIDQYVALPLNRKALTLQGIIYQYLKDDLELQQSGLTQGRHTGIPWLTTVITSINEVFRISPKLIHKLNLAQVSSHQNSIHNETAYNDKSCECNQKVVNALWNYQKRRNMDTIKAAAQYALSDKHRCGQDYKELVRVQAGLDMASIMKEIVNRLLPCLWTDSNEKRIRDFEIELIQYKGADI